MREGSLGLTRKIPVKISSDKGIFHVISLHKQHYLYRGFQQSIIIEIVGMAYCVY